MSEILYIKNMVCPRCIRAVEEVLDQMEIRHKKVELGEVLLEQTISAEELDDFAERIDQLGFQLLDPGKSSLVSQIKSLIIQQVHHSDEIPKYKFSTLISEKLHHEYSYLSRLFSSVEGITIEKFVTSQRIERVKEFLFYNELTLTEIADRLGYSSVSHLSSQFKKETGMTPGEFRKDRVQGRRSLDRI